MAQIEVLSGTRAGCNIPTRPCPLHDFQGADGAQRGGRFPAPKGVSGQWIQFWGKCKYSNSRLDMQVVWSASQCRIGDMDWYARRRGSIAFHRVRERAAAKSYILPRSLPSPTPLSVKSRISNERVASFPPRGPTNPPRSGGLDNQKDSRGSIFGVSTKSNSRRSRLNVLVDGGAGSPSQG